MKINLIGNMCTWCKKLSTSYIINEEILFDVPQGSFKTLFADYDLLKTKYIIISHFHSDHFMDIHLVMDYLYHHAEHKIVIIAPKGCRERLSSMFRLVEVAYLEEAMKEMFSIIECENNKILNIDGYKIKMYKMLHADIDSYGFTIEKEGVTIGFTGDSAMCNNVRKIISKSKTCFIDCAQIKVTNKHLCVQEIKSLIEEYPNCKIMPIHLSIYSEEQLKEQNIPYPNEGDIIYVN